MPAALALELAYQHRVHHLPVVVHEAAIGMVCTCDLQDAKPTDSVSSTMRSPPLSTSPDTLGDEALTLMNTHRVGSLLITEAGRILGIVTRKDLSIAGVAMFEDPRGFCSCCGSIAHLKEHATGALCADCFGRSTSSEGQLDHGGGD
jgi:CBS-domain-containing membrane protein